jgi:type I site-specific restriction-modification system R (restriction) subunit
MLTLAKHFQFQANNYRATKQLEGRKQNKERLTLALFYNGDGFDKLPLWVIEKYKNPCCFKNVNLGSLGCIY